MRALKVVPPSPSRGDLQYSHMCGCVDVWEHVCVGVGGEVNVNASDMRSKVKDWPLGTKSAISI